MELVKGCATIVANERRVGGIAMIAAVLSVTSFWYGGTIFVVAVRWARYGIVNVPALVVGAVELWVGGLLGLAAGTLMRQPPSLPDRQSMVGWTIVIFAAVSAVVVMRRPDVEASLPVSTRRAMDGRFIALGALAAVAGLFIFGYL